MNTHQILTQLVCERDTEPISLSNKTFTRSKLKIEIVRGLNFPERFLGAKPNSFLEFFIENNRQSVKTTTIKQRNVHPQYGEEFILNINNSDLKHNRKIIFEVRDQFTKRQSILLATGQVDIFSLVKLIHTSWEEDKSVKIQLNPTITITQQVKKPELIIKFSFVTIPNQALCYTFNEIKHSGVTITVLQDLLKISRIYGESDALVTLLNLTKTIKPNTDYSSLLHFLQNEGGILTVINSSPESQLISKDQFHFEIVQITNWLLRNSKFTIDQRVDGCALLSQAIINGNIKYAKWLLKSGASIEISHRYEGKELFLDELIHQIPACNEKIVKLVESVFRSAEKTSGIKAAKRERDLHNRIRELKYSQSGFSMEKIEQFAVESIKLQNKFCKIIVKLKQVFDNKRFGIKDDEIYQKAKEFMDTYSTVADYCIYANFSSICEDLSSLAEGILLNCANFSSEYEDILLMLLHLLLIYFRSNQPVYLPSINQSFKNFFELLSKYQSNASVVVIILQLIRYAIDFQSLSPQQYEYILYWLVDYLSDQSKIFFSDQSNHVIIEHTLHLIQQFSEHIIKLPKPTLKQSSLIPKLNEFVSDNNSIAVAAATIKIFGLIALFYPDILIETKCIDSAFQFLLENRNSEIIYERTMMLLNRLYSEKHPPNNSSSNLALHYNDNFITSGNNLSTLVLAVEGWSGFYPEKAGGGSIYIKSHLSSLKELIWFGLNTFDHSYECCLASLWMVWRLFYYGIIPDESQNSPYDNLFHRLCSFIDTLCLKIIHLWENQFIQNVKFQSTLLNILSHCLSVRILSKEDFIIQIAVKHNFLSRTLLSLKFFAHANFPTLMCNILQFIDLSLQSKTIRLGINANPTSFINDLFVCLQHPDFLSSSTVQKFGILIILKLLQEGNGQKLRELLDQHGVIHFYFDLLNNQRLYSIFDQVLKVLDILLQYQKLLQGFIRIDGISVICNFIRKLAGTSDGENYIIDCVSILNTCCRADSSARKLALNNNIQSLITECFSHYPTLQQNLKVSHFLRYTRGHDFFKN